MNAGAEDDKSNSVTIKAAAGNKARATTQHFCLIVAIVFLWEMGSGQKKAAGLAPLLALNIVLFIVSCALFFSGFHAWANDCDTSECVGHAGNIALQMLRVFVADRYEENPSLAVSALVIFVLLLVCFSVNVVFCITQTAFSSFTGILSCLVSHPFVAGAVTGSLLCFVQLYSFFQTDYEYNSSYLNCTIRCPELQQGNDNSPLLLIWLGIIAAGSLAFLNIFLSARHRARL